MKSPTDGVGVAVSGSRMMWMLRVMSLGRGRRLQLLRRSTDRAGQDASIVTRLVIKSPVRIEGLHVLSGMRLAGTSRPGRMAGGHQMRSLGPQTRHRRRRCVTAGSKSAADPRLEPVLSASPRLASFLTPLVGPRSLASLSSPAGLDQNPAPTGSTRRRPRPTTRTTDGHKSPPQTHRPRTRPSRPRTPAAKPTSEKRNPTATALEAQRPILADYPSSTNPRPHCSSPTRRPCLPGEMQTPRHAVCR